MSYAVNADVTVIGLGYVGLPLVKALLGAGHRVTGVDIAKDIVETLNGGLSHVDTATDDDIAVAIADGFHATDSMSCVADSAAVVVCVPTPLTSDHAPDLSALVSVCERISHHLRPGTLVVIESTTYPGTTKEVVRPILDGSGLTVGQGYHLAFSPERIDPGNQTFGIANTPKIVGGMTDLCTRRAYDLYASFVDHVVVAKGTTEAEMAKLLENTFRHVNIALVNEMVKFCHDLGIDLWNVIELAGSKPFGFQQFYPGPGVGGHCIPVDPNYLSHTVQARLGYPFRFVELAQEINESMPGYVYQRIQEMLNVRSRSVRGAQILLLGVTYKPDIGDIRESPAEPLARLLRKSGADLFYHDPHIGQWQPDGFPEPVEQVDDLHRCVVDADLVVLLQAHREYRSLGRLPDVAVLDTRGVLDGCRVEQL